MENRTYVKAALIAIAILIAAGGVLFFFNTQVAPPGKIDKVDVYAPDINEFVASYINRQQDNIDLKNDKIGFVVAVDRISIFHSDSLITASHVDSLMYNVVSARFDRFTGWAFEKFNKSVWNTADHAAMRQEIANLRGYKKCNDGQPILNSEQNEKLVRIEQIIADYNKAWSVSRNIYYGNAPQNITIAREYRNKPYISNCVALTHALGEVPQKVMKNHYSHVWNRLNGLSNYRLYKNRSSFNQAADNIAAEIRKFQNASYGVDKGSRVSDLNNKLNSIRHYALKYTWPDEKRVR